MSEVRLTQAQAVTAFRGYLSLAIGGGIVVWDAGQAVADGARPAQPYVMIDVARSRSLSSVWRRVGDEVDPDSPTGATHQLENTWGRALDIEVTAYGDTGMEILAKLEKANARLPEAEYQTAQGIAVMPAGDPVDTTILRDTTWEASAMQEFTVTYITQDLSKVGIIETAKVHGTDYPVVLTGD